VIGHRTFGWTFVGSDTDATALAAARAIVQANGLGKAIELRAQKAPAILDGLLRKGESFALSVCNPPFHHSPGEAQAGSRRKWTNLGYVQRGKPALNFGGHGGELWCEGGEVAFVRRMIDESAAIPASCVWFTTLVSRSSSLPSILSALKQVPVRDHRVIPMAQGQKQSRIVAWTFLDEGQRA
ncbi:MAG: RlmF-related methyltransferase, partial [Thermoanaerobaculia bacterium]